MLSVERDLTIRDEQGWHLRKPVPMVCPQDKSDAPRCFLGTLRGELVWPQSAIQPLLPAQAKIVRTFGPGDVILGSAINHPQANIDGVYFDGARVVAREVFEATYVECSA